jgi:hypothetical protein
MNEECLNGLSNTSRGILLFGWRPRRCGCEKKRRVHCIRLTSVWNGLVGNSN